MSDTIVQTNITLEELATSMFVNFELSDPRDAVFSLLSLSKEPLIVMTWNREHMVIRGLHLRKVLHRRYG